ncbi:MAG: glycosyltransferase [Anaerolineaceae bacterium]|nr:glycosyltransferase [Anaerolineaceae bacterium]
MTPRLSVIIVNYNTCDDLHACLTALIHDPIQPEIIVVDNASRDGSAEMIRRDFYRLDCWHRRATPGFAAGTTWE